MSSRATTIPAHLTIDPAALAGLQLPATNIAPLLESVNALLADVRERLERDERILVDGAEAARLTGLCEKTLRDAGAPHVKIGTARRYSPESLRRWARERERTAEGVES
jgi:hypothetical protein